MFKVIELFAGVGAQTQALKNIGVEHEVVGIVEIDKYAISSYMQLHGETPLLGDITKVDSLPVADLWTYSFPCQDLSVVGLGKGIKVGTRSGLLFEVERLLENSTKPKYLLMENVKNLVGKKNKPDFDRWCNKLEELGYTNYWQVLNAKDYGVPQNRERVFMVSILGEHETYIFPNKKELQISFREKVSDYLEVPRHVIDGYSRKKSVFKKRFNTSNGRIASCLVCKSGWGVITNNFFTSDFKKCSLEEIQNENIKLFALSPLEYWRLMGWEDEQFYKIKNISNAQLYKQAGNSIVVNVLEEIFGNLLKTKGENNMNLIINDSIETLKVSFTPAQIEIDLEPVRQQVQRELSPYNDGLMVEYKDGKKDLARLRALQKGIEDYRKRLQNKYMENFFQIEKELKEISNLFNAPIEDINLQIKEEDRIEKEEKREVILDFISTLLNPEVIIFNEKWLNKTYKIKDIKEEIEIQHKTYLITPKCNRKLQFTDLTKVQMIDMLEYFKSKNIKFEVITDDKK
ncbi:DNA (cytosine-5-)-methyltransferase [Cetobacterium sp.]|uniref:DNA (cytosine-5-)-methyltransferase n=1 Tax=Cetobacterium sp. TaxID=2071632 RepID=UPI003F338592